MGEVYRARDTRLNRPIAIKILPAGTANDPDRRARFEREAQSLAALNHPNIVTIHSVEDIGGLMLLTMELVDGRPLSDIITRDGRPIEEILKLAIPLADAVSAAHGRGITHRDLKPSNIMVTSEGRVKVLDFGLAKLREAELAGSLTDAPTKAITGEGQIVGTVAYMSPEQAEGLAVDHRSDIFSLGVILYEWSTGQRPFEGSSSVSVITAILRDTPPSVTDLKPALPADFARIVRRCLAKDPARRYQTAADLRNELEDLREDSSVSRTVVSLARPSRTAPGRALALVAAVGAVVVIGALAVYLVPRLAFGTSGDQPVAAGVGPLVSERQITTNPVENPILTAAISPDGRYVAYSDISALRVRLIDTGETRALPVPEGFCFICASLSWSADGTRILAAGPAGPAQKRGIWIISTLTGEIRQLADGGLTARFSPDGSRIAFVKDDAIWLMGADGANAAPWLKPETDSSVSDPRWSPDGRGLAYAKYKQGSDETSIEARSIDGGSPRVLVAAASIESLLWAGDSMLYVQHLAVDRHDLWQLPLDPAGQPGGPPVRLTRWDGPIPGALSVSPDGKRIVVTKTFIQSDVYAAELGANDPISSGERRLTSETRFDWPSGWTRDGKQVLLVSNRNGTDDIFAQAPATDNAMPLVQGKNARGPHMSPDGRWLVYQLWSEPEVGPGLPAVRVMRLLLSGGSPELVFDAKNPSASGDFRGWSSQYPDVRCPLSPTARCIIAEADGTTGLSFSAFDIVTGQREEVAHVTAPPGRVFWDLSPDGSRIAHVRFGPDEESPIRVLTVSNRTVREIPTNGWTSLSSIAWASDEKSLFLVSAKRDSSQLLHVGLNGSIATLREQTGRWLTSPRPSPDGRTLVFANTTMDSNIWLIEH
jgi:Tol biopolymer transport system component